MTENVLAEITTGIEVPTGERIVQETNEFTVVQLADGKFEKRMKYAKEWSYIPQTNEELLKFYQLTNSSEDEEIENLTAFKNANGEIIEIKNFYFTPYNSFDEETGRSASGVTTMIEGIDGQYYVTSSKKVYWDLRGMFDVFGKPNTPGYLGLKVAIRHSKVTGADGKKRDQMNLKLLGLSDNIKSAN